MFNIQYEALDGTHKMQDFDSQSYNKLSSHLAQFTRPIMAIYCNGNVITKLVRGKLRDWPGTKTRYAREFMQ